jgi:hypothetical protein
LEPKGKVGPESYRLELPFDVKSVHPLSRDQYLLEIDNTAQSSESSGTFPQQPETGNLFMLKKESSDDHIPTILSPISQQTAKMSEDSAANVEFLDKKTSNLLEIRYGSSNSLVMAPIFDIL